MSTFIAMSIFIAEFFFSFFFFFIILELPISAALNGLAVRFVLVGVTRFRNVRSVYRATSTRVRAEWVYVVRNEAALSRTTKATSATFLRNNGRVLSNVAARCCTPHSKYIYHGLSDSQSGCYSSSSNLLVRPCAAPHWTGELHKKLQLDSLNRHDRLIKASAIFFVRHAEIKISLN